MGSPAAAAGAGPEHARAQYANGNGADFGSEPSYHWSQSSNAGSEEEGEAMVSGRGKVEGRGRRRGGKEGRGGAGGEEGIMPYEWGNMALLVLLYAMQGIPLGLTMGAM